jgi:stearoyl-CoA desaturase (delta-9 desaturase)
MKRVGVLHGGFAPGLTSEDERSVPPSQRLRIARYTELYSSPYASSTAASDGEGEMRLGK